MYRKDGPRHGVWVFKTWYTEILISIKKSITYLIIKIIY